MSSLVSQVRFLGSLRIGILNYIYSLLAILAGYLVGTSLSAEAKTYRLLADLLIDAAIALDTLSPFFLSLDSHQWLPKGSGYFIRILALCLSGSLRAMCGAVAGGSKAAITLHFARTPSGNGDIGELNAKDGSKETVLALLGILVRHSSSALANTTYDLCTVRDCRYTVSGLTSPDVCFPFHTARWSSRLECAGSAWCNHADFEPTTDNPCLGGVLSSTHQTH
jgi:hypothetical protein